MPTRAHPRFVCGRSRQWLAAGLGLLLLNLQPSAFGQQILRGPYLQMATPTTITIRWRTDSPSGSAVRYGTNLANLTSIQTDTDEVADHEIALSGLSPLTRYFYSVGTPEGTFVEGADYFFITHPPAGQRKPTRIWAIGDCGTFNLGAGNQVGVRDAFYNYAGSRYTDVWLALGDNAYYYGTDEDYQENFFNIYPNILRQTPLWSTIGNHETYSVPVGERIPYEDIFTFPENGQAGGVPSGTEKYYSFNYANIHFVSLDSELSDRSHNGPMLTWLLADLEDNTNDWLIAFWHSPPYTKGSHDSDNLNDNFGNMTQMRANVLPMLEAYGVDLVLSGHSHIYERSYFLSGHYGFSGTLQPSMIKDSGSGRTNDTGAYLKQGTGPSGNEGAVYVVAGSAGWATSRTGYHPAMYYDALQMGSLIIDVDGNRLDARFLRETGTIDDHFTILKGAPAEPLHFATFRRTTGNVLATWKSVAGQTYRVQRASSLETKDWADASIDIIATGATTSWTDAIPGDADKSFYRVVVP